MAKQRVLIIGGGMSALTTAYQLSRTAELRERYAITIYQTGWKLGGKLASGRRRPNLRNIEHGLHVWFGFYENAFALLRDCYANWKRDPECPLETWRDAFRPRSYTPIGGVADGKWTYYPALWPENSDTPGDGSVWPSTWAVITEVVNLLKHFVGAEFDQVDDLPDAHLHLPERIGALYRKVMGARGGTLADDSDRMHASAVMEAVHHWCRALGDEAARAPAEHREALAWLLREFKSLYLRVVAPRRAPSDGGMHLVRDAVDLGVGILSGLLDPRWDILDHEDLNRINGWEYRKWLRAVGVSSDVVEHSSLVRFVYDAAFQYEDGDLGRPNFEAGTAVRCLLRILATYKGALIYEVTVGMGESVITPLYEVLLDRGVRIEFFRPLTRMELSPDRSRVQRIRFAEQVKLKGEYQPLITVKGLKCWSAEAPWDQIVDGDKMEAAGINLESKWRNWPPVGEEVLEHGKDFDIVVLATSVGALKPLGGDPGPCDELLAANPRLRDAVEKLPLVPALGIQLWLSKDLQELGFEFRRQNVVERPAMVSGPGSLGIWADMSQALPFEDWGDGSGAPKSLHFFCGVYQTDLYKTPSSDSSVPERCRALVRRIAIDWLATYTGFIWPRAVVPGTPGIDWQILHDPEGREGEARLDAQVLRANIEPTECCEVAFTGTEQYRLRSDESGFSNLFLAGTWLRTGLNVSCVEAAVMSGMQCARAISGSPHEIVGEYFLQRPPAPTPAS